MLRVVPDTGLELPGYRLGQIPGRDQNAHEPTASCNRGDGRGFRALKKGSLQGGNGYGLHDIFRFTKGLQGIGGSSSEAL